MKTFQSLFKKITKEDHWIHKVLLGCLLSFIPIINFFACGYLYRYAKRVTTKNAFELPEWNHWGKLFFDGLVFFIVFAVYFFFPILIGFLLSLFLGLLTMEMLGWFHYIPLTLALLIAPSLTLFTLYSLVKGEGTDFLLNVRHYFTQWLISFPHLLIPSLAFLGFGIIGLSLYGIAFFIGFLGIIVYTLPILVELDKRNKE